MAGRFVGKVCIVTGSSNGIGRETARLFAEEGAFVTLTGRSEKSLQDSVNLLKSAGADDDRIHTVRGNMIEENVQKSIVNETLQKFGKIDILINNAGAVAPDLTTTHGFDQPLEAFDYVMDLNVRSTLAITKNALPHLEKSQGEIVNLSSISGLPFAFPVVPYYGISKAAVAQLTRNMAVSFITKGIRVNAVVPGLVTSDIFIKQGMTEAMRDEAEEKLANNRVCIPAGVRGTPRDIAEAIAFLADRSKSRYILGHCLVVDGGTTIVNAFLSTCL